MKKLIVYLLALNLLGCGYFLYPERVGQTDGRIDPTVVILDAAGLLFGVLPGVVAFAVDLSTGAIYLPAGGKSALEKHTNKLSHNETLQSGVNPEAVARELTMLLGQPVDASALDFYSTEGVETLTLAAYRAQ